MADVQETLDLRRRAPPPAGRRHRPGAGAVIVLPMVMDPEPQAGASKLSVEIPRRTRAASSPRRSRRSRSPRRRRRRRRPPRPRRRPKSPRRRNPRKRPRPKSTSATLLHRSTRRPSPRSARPGRPSHLRPRPLKRPSRAPEPAAKPPEAARKSADTARAEAAVSGAAEAFVIPARLVRQRRQREAVAGAPVQGRHPELHRADQDRSGRQYPRARGAVRQPRGGRKGARALKDLGMKPGNVSRASE